MMRLAWVLVTAVVLTGPAVAQSTRAIASYEQTRIREVVIAAGFPLVAEGNAKWVVGGSGSVVLPNGKTVKPGTEIRMLGIIGDRFRGPDGLVFNVIPAAEGLILSSRVPLPAGVDPNNFLEVFNNTNPTVKLYKRGKDLVCDRYIQLAGGVSEAYLREAIRSYVAPASTLMDGGRH